MDFLNDVFKNMLIFISFNGINYKINMMKVCILCCYFLLNMKEIGYICIYFGLFLFFMYNFNRLKIFIFML